MRSAVMLPALAGFVFAAPRPSLQVLKVAAVETFPAVRVSSFLDTTEDVPRRVQASPVEPIKPDLVRRDGDCAPRPSGHGPVPTPDTADAFRNFTILQVNFLSSPHISS